MRHTAKPAAVPCWYAVLNSRDGALTPAAIDKITGAYGGFIEAARMGRATRLQFWQMIECHYFYSHLLRVLDRQELIGSDHARLLGRLELDVALNEALNITPDVIDTIGRRERERYAPHGGQSRFVCTGGELRHLEASAAKFRAMLALCDTVHYMQAVRNAAPHLDSALHAARARRSA